MPQHGSVPLRATAFLTAYVGRGSKTAEGLKVFIGREADDLYYPDAEHFISGGVAVCRTGYCGPYAGVRDDDHPCPYPA